MWVAGRSAPPVPSGAPAVPLVLVLVLVVVLPAGLAPDAVGTGFRWSPATGAGRAPDAVGTGFRWSPATD